jgi:hypothetical protein
MPGKKVEYEMTELLADAATADVGGLISALS